MFERDQKEACEQVAHSLDQEIARVDALHKEIVKDIGEVDARRKKDRIHTDRDLQRVERDAQAAHETSEYASSSLEYLTKVLALVLEGEKMANALHIQEFADRCGECWLASPADAKRKPPATHTAQSLEKLKPNYEHLGRGMASEDMMSLVPIDAKRGLAKLEYQPGAISYGGSQFDRKGFLLLHHRMLTKARSFLDRGPGQFTSQPVADLRDVSRAPQYADDEAEPPEESKITMQPGANGGRGGTELSALPKSGSCIDEVSEDREPEYLKATGSAGHSGGGSGSNDVGQRPGSRHQPGARGSSAGDPSRSQPLRLPDIHGGSRSQGSPRKANQSSPGSHQAGRLSQLASEKWRVLGSQKMAGALTAR
jgi:hypothetical protein